MSKYYDELVNLAEKDEEKIKKTLIQNYVQSIAEMKKKIKDYTQTNEALSFAKQMELKRYDSLIEQMNSILKGLYDNNYNAIVDYDITNFDREYFGVFYQAENIGKVNLQFSLLNEDYIRQAIEAPIEGLKLSERLYDKNLNDMKLRVKGAVTQGLINSNGYASIAENISSIGWTDFNHALTIARTEGGRIKSLGRQQGQQEAVNKGVDLQKKWLSTLDKKTRHSHQKLDGQIVAIDEEFEINGHKAPQPRLFGVASEDINCRCDTVTLVEGISSRLRRDNITKDTVTYKNYENWYKNRVEPKK
ncbi:phage minor head protein [Clostridium sp. UBA1652]|uniref:phage head morphogenesis protein n=1 Tax=Clostridium sp. UBA1652 TaxID=1946348 RepID=UPI0025801A56|nr:phage minor head protein [Clostridium sp. UBA1652]